MRSTRTRARAATTSAPTQRAGTGAPENSRKERGSTNDIKITKSMGYATSAANLVLTRSAKGQAAPMVQAAWRLSPLSSPFAFEFTGQHFRPSALLVTFSRAYSRHAS
jgi:hypothetical protein